jgi:hypothetical protein
MVQEERPRQWGAMPVACQGTVGETHGLGKGGLREMGADGTIQSHQQSG